MIQLRKIKNTRADMTLNMVVKIVLSVLSIIVLIYLAGSLYGIFTKKSKLEQARASLDELINEINGLQEGVGREHLLTSPAKWILVFNEKELCICDEKYGEDYTSCCNDGASQNIGNVVIEDSCVINTGVFTRNQIMQGCIHLKPLPRKIYLDKEGKTVSLTSNKITPQILANKFQDDKTTISSISSILSLKLTIVFWRSISEKCNRSTTS